MPAAIATPRSYSRSSAYRCYAAAIESYACCRHTPRQRTLRQPPTLWFQAARRAYATATLRHYIAGFRQVGLYRGRHTGPPRYRCPFITTYRQHGGNDTASCRLAHYSVSSVDVSIYAAATLV